MKVGAGGLQAYATQDEVASRQAQETRRPDYQPKPVNHSANTQTLNRYALNKTVERPNDGAAAYDLPLRFPPPKREDNQSGAKTQNEDSHREKTGGDKDMKPGNIINPFTGSKLDRYI